MIPVRGLQAGSSFVRSLNKETNFKARMKNEEIAPATAMSDSFTGLKSSLTRLVTNEVYLLDRLTIR